MTWYKIKDNYVTFNIKVKVNKNETRIVSVDKDFIHVEIHSLPIEGRANEELIKYFSKLFKVAQYLIEFVRGETSKIKTLRMKVSEYTLIFIDSNNATIKIQDRVKVQI